MNLFWVDNIAGCNIPRSRNDVEWLSEQGLGAIISLTEQSLPPDWVKNFTTIHVPIMDFCSPTFEQSHQIIDFIEACLKNGIKPVVHCTMGYGRTGTAIAMYLIYKGLSAEDAISKVREQRPGAIETYGQEDSLYFFEQELRGKKSVISNQ